MQEQKQFSAEMLERLLALGGDRVRKSQRGFDFYEVSFHTNSADEYSFKAFVYDEEMLEIVASEPTVGTLWSRPFERADFHSRDEQWSEFAQVLKLFFGSKSHIEIRSGLAFVSTTCFVDDRDKAVWTVSHPSLSKYGKSILQFENRVLRSGPIGMVEHSEP